jgi:hypothetical protein
MPRGVQTAAAVQPGCDARRLRAPPACGSATMGARSDLSSAKIRGGIGGAPSVFPDSLPGTMHPITHLGNDLVAFL